jgi:hypothetical protein
MTDEIGETKWWTMRNSAASVTGRFEQKIAQ